MTRRDNERMALVPPLQVVPLAEVKPHEEVDPMRVDALMGRIAAEGRQGNPVICAGSEEGLVVLDGATRTEAMRRLGMAYLVVQVVSPDSVTLETWHHVIRNCPPAEVLARVESSPDLLTGPAAEPPRVAAAGGESLSIMGRAMSPYSTLSALVNAYLGRWTVSRIIDPAPEVVASRFPDWSVIVEFPTMSVEEVMKAALGDDLLPAGITRFLIPERVLRLNVDIELLGENGSRAGKQEALDALVQARSRAGRIRRYEETVILLDD